MAANQAGAILEALGVNDNLSPTSPTKWKCTENSTVVDVAKSVTVAENRSTAVTAADGVVSMSRLPDSAD